MTFAMFRVRLSVTAVYFVLKLSTLAYITYILKILNNWTDSTKTYSYTVLKFEKYKKNYQYIPVHIAIEIPRKNCCSFYANQLENTVLIISSIKSLFWLQIYTLFRHKLSCVFWEHLACSFISGNAALFLAASSFRYLHLPRVLNITCKIPKMR